MAELTQQVAKGRKLVKLPDGQMVDAPESASDEYVREMYEQAKTGAPIPTQRAKEAQDLLKQEGFQGDLLLGDPQIGLGGRRDPAELQDVGARFGGGRFNLDTMTEQGRAILKANPDISPSDIIALKLPDASEHSWFIRDPKTGQIREADSPHVNELDVADLIGQFAHSPVETAGTIAAGLFPETALGRIGATTVAGGVGNIIDRFLQQGAGVQETDPLSPESLARSAGSGLAAGAGQSLGEGLGLASRGLTGRVGRGYEDIIDLARQSEAAGLGHLAPTRADVNPSRESRYLQAAASTQRGKEAVLDKLGRTYEEINSRIPALDQTDFADLHTTMQNSRRQVVDAATSRLGTTSPIRTPEVLSAIDNFEAGMDKEEQLSAEWIKRVVEDNNLAFDLGARKAQVERLSFETLTERRATPEQMAALKEDPTAKVRSLVKINPADSELYKLLQEYLISADVLQTLENPVIGGETMTGRFNPVEALTSIHRRARKLLGSDDPEFNNRVHEFIDVLGDTLREPVIRQGTGPGAFVMPTPKRYFGGPAGSGKRSIPGDFDNKVNDYLNISRANDDTRSAMRVVDTVRDAVKTGREMDLGRELISPNDPQTINHIEQIGKRSNRPDLLTKVSEGYRQYLIENPDIIEREIGKWKGPEQRRLFAKIASTDQQDSLIRYSRNVARMDRLPLTEALDTDPGGLTAPVIDAIAKSDSQALRSIITASGGKDSTTTRVIKAGLMKYILEESSTPTALARGGFGMVVDPDKYIRVLSQFDKGKLLEEIMSPKEIKFWHLMKDIIPLMPKAARVGDRIISAQIAAQAGTFPVTPGMAKEFLRGREAKLKQEAYAYLYTSPKFQAAFSGRLLPSVEKAGSMFLNQLNRISYDAERDMDELQKSGLLRVRSTPVVDYLGSGLRGAGQFMMEHLPDILKGGGEVSGTVTIPPIGNE